MINYAFQHARIQRGGGVWKNHKNIGFLSNTGPEKSQSYQQSQHSSVGHHRPASEMPKWPSSFWYLDPISPHKTRYKNTTKRNVIRVGLAKLSGSVHDKYDCKQNKSASPLPLLDQYSIVTISTFR